MKQKYGWRGVVQPDDSEASPAADMESPDSRPASLRGPENRNAYNEIQVSFSHAGLGTNMNERFTEYRERMRSVLQRSHDRDAVGDDQISSTVQKIRTKLQTVCLDSDRRNVTVNMAAWTTYLSNRNIFWNEANHLCLFVCLYISQWWLAIDVMSAMESYQHATSQSGWEVSGCWTLLAFSSISSATLTLSGIGVERTK